MEPTDTIVSDKKIIILAGPNGAGKTTFAREFLLQEASCPAFINADLIAAGLSPFDPARVAVRAGRLMLEEIHAHVRRGESFAIETTLSGKGYAALIPEWRSCGYRIKLYFLRLASPELALERVHQRVLQMGHDIPESVVRRRFAAGLHTFEQLYKPLVNEWALYDNSETEPVRIMEGGDDGMNDKTPEFIKEAQPRSRDPDMVGAEAALRRAAATARRKAREVGQGVFIWKDGRVVEDRSNLESGGFAQVSQQE